MFQQMISAPKWWKQMSLLVFFPCFKISQLLISLPPWQNSVGFQIIFDCVRTNDSADDFRSKMVETDVVSRIFGLIQDSGWGTRWSPVKAIAALGKFGRLIYYFVLCKD
jgi:hypothetical protein